MTFSRSTPMTRPKPWQTGQAPSGELNAKSAGVGSRKSAPQPGQWSPRRNVRARSSKTAESDPAIANAESAAAAISARDSSRTTNRPTTTGRRPSASRSASTSSGISTVSPAAESARKNPARFNSSRRMRSSRALLRDRRPFPSLRHGRGATSVTLAPGSARKSSSTARSTPPPTAARSQTGQNVVPPCAKRSRSES